MSSENAVSSGTEKPTFGGKYVLVRQENLDQFLAANGVPWFVRKMIGSSTPSLEVSEDGEKFNFRLNALGLKMESNFTVGEECEDTQQDGAVYKVTPYWDGNKLVQNYEPKDPKVGKPQVYTREIDGDNLILTMQVDNITCKRIFKKSN